MDLNKHHEQLLDSWLALTGDGSNRGEAIRLPMLSGSMRPGIPVDSLLHIQKSSAAACPPGAVMIYRDGDRLVAHRLLWRLGWGSRALLFEKGDANDRGRWIRSGQVLGMATAVLLPGAESPQSLLPDRSQAWRSLLADARHRILAFPRRLKRGIFKS